MYLVTTVCISVDNAAIVLVAMVALAVVVVIALSSVVTHASDKLFK